MGLAGSGIMTLDCVVSQRVTSLVRRSRKYVPLSPVRSCSPVVSHPRSTHLMRVDLPFCTIPSLWVAITGRECQLRGGEHAIITRFDGVSSFRTLLAVICPLYPFWEIYIGSSVGVRDDGLVESLNDLTT